MQLETLDELHKLAGRVISKTKDMPVERKKKEIVDEVYELLILAYLFGMERAAGDIRDYEEEQREARADNPSQTTVPPLSQMPSQEAEIQYSPQEMYEAIYKPVAGETFEERIDRRLREGTLDTETLSRIIDTDYHRCEETGAYNTAQQYAESSGRQAYKSWMTMMDSRVRETHWSIQSVEVPMDGRFYTFDGDSARFPGDFEFADNNINCRCWLHYTFR